MNEIFPRVAGAPSRDEHRPPRGGQRFDRGAVASAARISIGVRLLAASVIPVIALVRPGPRWTDSTPSPPLTRGYAPTVTAAPPSCRAAANRAPAAVSALATWKSPLPATPNTVVTS